MKHKFWHFIYGRHTEHEIVCESKNVITSDYYEVCNKCGEQVGEKKRCSTFSMNLTVIPDNTTSLQK